MAEFWVREMGLEHVAGAAALQRACFPPPFPEELLWNPSHLSHHVRAFPEGQFVAVSAREGQVIASASNCIIGETTWQSHLGWFETVGGPYIEGHDPNGSTLYGLDVSVHPEWRGIGILRALYRARFELVRRRGLKRYGTAVRIPGFAAYQVGKEDATPENYVQAVQRGEVIDRTLTPMLRVGLEPRGVIRDYMDDPESGNAAAVLEWQP